MLYVALAGHRDAVHIWKEVPAAETLRVNGPTSGTSSVRVIQVRVPVTEGLPQWQLKIVALLSGG
jgi:hypothetical protein